MKLKINKSSLTLRLVLISAFAFIVILTSGLLGYASLVAVKSFIEKDFKARLQTIAGLAAIQLDAAALKKIKVRADESSPEFAGLRKKLNDIKSRSPDIEYVYTFRVNSQNEIIFAVDGDADLNSMAHVGDKYETPTRAMLQPFRGPTDIHLETGLSTDKWGSFISSFAPIYGEDKKLEGIVGVDISSKVFFEYEGIFILQALFISASVSIIVILIGIRMAQFVSKPLHLLTQDLKKIQTFEFATSKKLTSPIYEVVEISNAVENMKKGLRSFAKYVPSELVRDLISLKQEALLGVESKPVTVFFSDIENFTSYCEKVSAEELSSTLGIYYSILQQCLLNSGATLDKFIGDSVMAFWGAPRVTAQPEWHACMAALECQAQLKAAFEKTNLPSPFRIRYGIHSGPALVGNIGSRDRFTYTVLGDTVNTASRLEKLNKDYGTGILVSETVHAKVQDSFLFKEMGNVTIRGKEHPLKMFELLAKI